MTNDPALEMAARLRRRDVTSVEVVRDALASIRAQNATLAAFVRVDEARAMREAVRADAMRARGVDLPFLGVPVGIKDHEPVRGFVTGLGSRAFRWLYTPFDGEIARAMRRAGFVIVGKTATSELTILPIVDHPPTRSPIAPAHYAGGSSGGAASAVAANMIPMAPGSDGGGSIRIPASLCGLVGVKPSRGAMPNPYGSLDAAQISTVGSLARTVRDAAALMDVLAGTASPSFARSYRAACDEPIPSRLRVRILLSSTLARVDPEVASITVDVAKRIEALGHSLAPAQPLIASVDEMVPIFAHMAAKVPMLPIMERALQPSTRWLREIGATVSGADSAARGAELSRRVLDWFGETDILVTPTVAQLPPSVGSYADLDGEATFRAMAPLGAFTAPFNLSGQPAISLPVGTSRSGLPIGVQLVGRPHSDRLLLALATHLT